MATDYATEKAAEAQAVQRAALEILTHFTGWRHDTEKEARYNANGWNNRIAWLTDGDRLISVMTEQDDKTRISIGGTYTPERDDSYRQGYERDLARPSITISRDRIERIGIEVERRLLPKLDAGNFTYRARVAGHDAYASRVDVNLARMAAAIVAEPWENNSRDGKRLTWHYNSGAGYGEAKVYDETISLDLHSLGIELAERILRMIRAEQDTEVSR